MDSTSTPSAAVAAFQSFYLAELDKRVQRSEAVGAITLKKGSAALFYESVEGKFTLVEKMPDVEAATVFDCQPREQWGRTVMLFGHATHTGGYIASGHATLDGTSLKIKLASGRYYRIDVDPSLAHLQPFVSTAPASPAPRPEAAERGPRPARGGAKLLRRDGRKPRPGPDAPAPAMAAQPSYDADESEDLTEEDLRRLRGELPLSTKPKRQWKR